MRFIDVLEDGTVDLQRYEAYLDGARKQMSAEMSGGEGYFAVARNGLAGRSTFHDSRLAEVTVAYGPVADNGHDSSAVCLRLRGPYFDRHFLLSYRGVIGFQGTVPDKNTDLLFHELRLDDTLWVHEFVFDGGVRLLVRAEHMAFSETLEA